ncbi:pyruvoyl-dependent arginine decarboxylase [Archaeoglobus veneficus]|uniref:Pyruvoyl-dependent arginine decarboxylase n=1 Tax=Archaeoglobus veneficus (strain DSM 11195 / SNP6) TaxID=693661 RepID=F2KR12_ARCVS|nr:Pyruvoyl-dependent arginine decarboxylase [Archaeoglobus veneficus SNP6]
MSETTGIRITASGCNYAQKSGDLTVSHPLKLVPRKVFFTKGVGSHEDALVSFELALRDAGIEKFNLVPVSSIYPPGCEIVEQEDGLKELSPGQIVFCVMARETSNEEGKEIFASIGAAIPSDPSLNGYITEYHGYRNGEEDMGRYAEEMAAYMLRTAFEIEPAKTFSVTARAVVEKDKYTTVVAAAVFVI